MARTTDTRERLLAAAERLFLERGFRETSTRDITEAAGTNLAAVNYHFRSKQDLMVAVAERIVRPVLDLQLDRLHALRTRPGPARVEDIVTAYVTPFVEQREGERGEEIARFVSQMMYEGTELAHRIVAPVEDQYRAELARALPGLSDQERELRFRAVIGTLLMYGLGLLTDGLQDAGRERTVERITAFCVAGLAAPGAGG